MKKAALLIVAMLCWSVPAVAHDVVKVNPYTEEQDTSGNMKIMGRVRNDGATAVPFVEITATLYDAVPDVIGVARSYVHGSSGQINGAVINSVLYPGETGAFVIVSATPFAQVDSIDYDINVGTGEVTAMTLIEITELYLNPSNNPPGYEAEQNFLNTWDIIPNPDILVYAQNIEVWMAAIDTGGYVRDVLPMPVIPDCLLDATCMDEELNSVLWPGSSCYTDNFSWEASYTVDELLIKVNWEEYVCDLSVEEEEQQQEQVMVPPADDGGGGGCFIGTTANSVSW
jgi:hypothetical protein